MKNFEIFFFTLSIEYFPIYFDTGSKRRGAKITTARRLFHAAAEKL